MNEIPGGLRKIGLDTWVSGLEERKAMSAHSQTHETELVWYPQAKALRTVQTSRAKRRIARYSDGGKGRRVTARMGIHQYVKVALHTLHGIQYRKQRHFRDAFLPPIRGNHRRTDKLIGHQTH